jgi:hypothetical protein
MKNFPNIQGQYEKDILNLVNVYLNSPFLINDLKIDSYDLRESFAKACIAHLGNSKKFLNFINDFYSNNLKESYSFLTKEEVDLAYLFTKKIKKKITFLLEFKLNYLVKIIIFKFIIIFINFIKFFIRTKKNNPKFLGVGFYVAKNSDKFRADKIYSKKYLRDKYLKKFNFLNFISNKYNFDKRFFFFKKYYFTKSKHLIVYKVLISFFLIQQEILSKKKSVVISFEGDHYDHEIIFCLSKIFKIKSICIQSATDLNIFPKACFHNIHQNKYLVWGKHYVKIFKNISPNLKTVVVGNYLLDINFNNKTRNKIGIFLKQKNDYLNNDEILEFENFVNWLIFNFKKNILIRPHPSDTRDDFDILKYRNAVEIDNPNKITVGETLKKCSFIVACNSSVIIEALSMGIVPIIFNKSIIFEKNIHHLSKSNFKIISSNIQDLKTRVVKLLSDNNYSNTLSVKLKKKFKNYINFHGNVSLNKIRQTIDKELQA